MPLLGQVLINGRKVFVDCQCRHCHHVPPSLCLSPFSSLILLSLLLFFSFQCCHQHLPFSPFSSSPCRHCVNLLTPSPPKNAVTISSSLSCACVKWEM